VHNSSAKNGNAYGDNGAMWRNVMLRNNVFLGTRYAFEFTTVRDEGYRDLDHNAWGTDQTDQPGGPWFKWENVRYDRIGDLPGGVEDNGIEIDFGDLVAAALPASWDIEASVGVHDLRPTGTQLRNLGEQIPNLNDPFVTDDAPDVGAFEAGMPMPLYGPGGSVPGPFIDVPAWHLFATEIGWLSDEGITTGCNPPFGDRFCPAQPVTRAQLASFLARALDLAGSAANYFTDDDGSTHEANINALAAAEITLGCTPTTFCPNDLITRAQMASLLARALDLPAEPNDRFTDDDGNTHEANINALARAGITTGCTVTTYCPADPVVRSHMAAFLYRALSD